MYVIYYIINMPQIKLVCLIPNSPHVDMEGIILVDFKASRPNAIGNVHQPDTQQLIVVIAWPVEHHTGTRQGGNVAIRVGCSLKHTDHGL